MLNPKTQLIMDNFINHQKSFAEVDAQKFFDVVEPSTYQTIMLALRFRMEHCMKQMQEAKAWGFIDTYNYWSNELKSANDAYNALP